MALRLIYNPVSGTLDYVNDASAPSSSKYTDTFNATSDWTLNVSNYEINIPAATHGAGTSPLISVFELESGNYNYTNVAIAVNNLGDVTLAVNSSPDLRFEGKVVIY